MGDDTKVVKVVKTINTGVKTIPVNSLDAVNIARQNANNGVGVVNTQVVQPQQIVMTPINPNPNEVGQVNQMPINQNPLMNNNQNQPMNQQYSQEDVDMVNDVNDLVKVVDVKYSKKTVLIMVGVIVLLIIIFLVFELPMLMEM